MVERDFAPGLPLKVTKPLPSAEGDVASLLWVSGQQWAWPLSACTPAWATGQEAPGLERMYRVSGSGPASAATAQGELGQKKPGSREVVATGGHTRPRWLRVCPGALQGRGEGQKSHGCESVAAALWSPQESQVAALGGV